MKINSKTAIKAKIKNDPAPKYDCINGKHIPTIKFPAQFAILPSAIALGRGPTSNSSEPIKYGIGPRPIP